MTTLPTRTVALHTLTVMLAASFALAEGLNIAITPASKAGDAIKSVDDLTLHQIGDPDLTTTALAFVDFGDEIVRAAGLNGINLSEIHAVISELKDSGATPEALKEAAVHYLAGTIEHSTPAAKIFGFLHNLEAHLFKGAPQPAPVPVQAPQVPQNPVTDFTAGGEFAATSANPPPGATVHDPAPDAVDPAAPAPAIDGH